MAPPTDPSKLALVRKAITCGLRNCCEWHGKAALRFRSSDASGLTPEMVCEELIGYVRNGGDIVQVVEKREEYRHHEFYYKVILPVAGLTRGLFVELVLSDERDPEFPAVTIVNAHAQRS